MPGIPLGPGALILIGCYLASLLLVGWLGYRARREHTLLDFYLAGGRIGPVVLLLTLFATQYSGNTLLGFTGKTYRDGFTWLASLHFMTAIIVVYLLFAPQLHRLAKRHRFITPTSFLSHRYNTPSLDVLATAVMIIALANFLLAQLMAMGRVLEGLADESPWRTEAYVVGVVLLAIIMVVYENLGGMRAVAWTDAIQGLVLLAGLTALVVTVFSQFGSLQQATETILADPLHRSKALPPGGAALREWLSYVVLVGLGGALYPQAIQRIYAARSERALRGSLAVMALMPLATTLVAVVVGIIGLAHLPHLAGPEADRVLSLLCRQVALNSTFGYWLVVVLLAAILAAVMSTADSALLSISSMATNDLYGRHVRPGADEAHLTRVGKSCSWVLLAVLVGVAIALRTNTTLIDLLDQKFNLLVQLVPAFILGIHWRRLHGPAVLAGLVTGLALAVGLELAVRLDWIAEGKSKLFGIHAGLYGLAANLLVAVAGSVAARRERPAGA